MCHVSKSLLLAAALIPTDRTRAADDAVVGTYRMLRHEVAVAHGGHYTADEYDITPLIASLGSHKACEIGRSCVHRDYRNNATIQLLWRGLAKYYADNNITRVFGCASLAGTDRYESAASALRAFRVRVAVSWSSMTTP